MSIADSMPLDGSPGDFTMHLTALQALHDADKRKIAALETQVAALERELEALKAGYGISLIIAGQRFDLAPEDEPARSISAPDLLDPTIRSEVSQKLAAVQTFRASLEASEPHNGHKSGVEDSFVL